MHKSTQRGRKSAHVEEDEGDQQHSTLITLAISLAWALASIVAWALALCIAAWLYWGR